MQRRLGNSLSWVSVYPGTPKAYVTVEDEEVDIEKTLSQFDATTKTEDGSPRLCGSRDYNFSVIPHCLLSRWTVEGR